uniref:(d)CMP kinase n=1 Tax=Odontella aurita TaxID=265563 RepID=A0A7S4JR56_9STRA
MSSKSISPVAVAVVAVGATIGLLLLSRRRTKAKNNESSTGGEGEVTYEVLSRQDASTSNAIIERFTSSSDFASLADREGSAILARDQEDAEKLQKGIDYAKEKGVIDPKFVPEEYISIDVLGKTPVEVADMILAKVNEEKKGSIVVLCGLSGTGKGTTVSTLKTKLESDGSGREVVSWSNGNIFRSVTLLAATWCEQQEDCEGFDKDKALTKENLASFMGMLEFGKFKDGKYDTCIRGLGLDLLVSEVQNTELKAPKVSKNIPTVAQVTQGEVILFAAEAVKKMGDDGIVVLLEGREQTVNYVRTPLRFILTLSDGSLIGKRRAAQRIMAAALEDVKESAWPGEIDLALEGQLKKMVAEGEK